jgi:cholesterol transport system auxiliary component
VTARGVFAAAGAALVVAGCSIGAPAPHTTTYVLDPPQPTKTSTTRHPQTLRMGNVRVAPAFASPPLVYRTGEVQYTPDFYNAFIADPGPLLGASMAEWLDRAGPFKTVSQPGGQVNAPYALEAVVTELYGDFRPGRKPAAVMTVQFTLVDLSGPSPTVVLERFIGRRVDLGEATPDALVRGYSQALGQILEELSMQIGAATSG